MPVLGSTYFPLFVTKWPLLAITYLIFLHFRFLLSQAPQYQISTSFAFFHIHSPPSICLCHVLDHSSGPAITWAFRCGSDTGKCSVTQLSLCCTQPVSAALASPGVAQLYGVQCSPAPFRSFPWVGRAHTCTDNSTVTNKVSGDNAIQFQVINTIQFRSQVRILVIVICPTTSVCCEFGHFFLSLSS